MLTTETMFKYAHSLITITFAVIVTIPVIVCKDECKNETLLATETAAFLTSPNYPNAFPSNVNCFYRIQASSSNIVVLRIVDFSLPSFTNPEFLNYFVEIYDGNTTNYYTTSELRGKVSSRTFVSSGSIMTIQFRTGSLVNYKGFKFEYTSQNKSAACGNTKLTANHTSQILTSSNFPYVYACNMTCQWLIAATSSSQIVVLKLSSFNLGYSTCTDRNVSLYDGNSTLSPRMQMICGEVTNATFTSTGNSMTIVFQSECRASSGNGFEFVYTAQARPNMCTSVTELWANENKKYITSPGYPDNYTDSSFCVWHIRASLPTDVIMLKMMDFSLEESSSCTADAVAIYDGEEIDTRISTLCGQKSNRSFVSRDHALIVVFHSDNSISNKGFRFQYSSQKFRSMCKDVNLVASSDPNYIFSPNYPKSYPKNTNCKWTITTSSTQVIQLKSLDFDIRSSYYSYRYLMEDNVAIFDGPNTSSLRKKFFYGTTSKILYISTGNSMTVTFTSGNTSSIYSYDSGFKFEYTSQNRSALCKKTELIALYGLSQTIETPDYSISLPSDMHCEWHISAASGFQVLITVRNFNVEDTPPLCTNKYVAIYNGNSTDSPIKTLLCGSVPTSQYTSSDSYMTVVFHSDSSVAVTNFEISYSSQYFTVPCNNTMLVATADYKYIDSPSFNSINSTRRIITNCKWYITTNSDFYVVKINITSLNITSIYSSYCPDSYLAFYSGKISYSNLEGKVCSSEGTRVFQSEDSNMTIEFKADETLKYNSFKLFYYSVPKISVVPCNDATLVATADHKYLKSPTNVYRYNMNSNCVWHIKTDSDSHVININFTKFHLQGSPPYCHNDYLEIYNDSSLHSSPAVTLCGYFRSRTFQSSGTTMTFIYHLDESITYDGFELIYYSTLKTAHAITSLCNDTKLVATSAHQYIESPNYPKDYLRNTDCKWHITTNSDLYQVYINITDFWLQVSYSNCDNDYLAIYDGANSFSRLIAKLCGHSDTRSFQSTGTNLTIAFHSDASVEFSGFRLYFYSNLKIVAAPCEDTTLVATSEHKYIEMPHFPTKYPRMTSCKWQILTHADAHVVFLNISKFFLEGDMPDCTSGYLAIYDGANTSSRRIAKLCGHLSTEILKSTGSNLTIVFHSDGSHNGVDFQLGYHSLFKIDTAPCNSGTLFATSDHKYIESPNYPFQYSSNTKCEWHITTKSDSHVIYVSITKFLLEGNLPDCTRDYLAIYDGKSTSANKIVQLCGKSDTKTFQSTSKDMTIIFQTDGTKNYNGFHLYFYSTLKIKSDPSFAGGAIAAIVISVLTIIIISVIVVYVWRIRAKKKSMNQHNTASVTARSSNVIYCAREPAIPPEAATSAPFVRVVNPQASYNPHLNMSKHKNTGAPYNAYAYSPVMVYYANQPMATPEAGVSNEYMRVVNPGVSFNPQSLPNENMTQNEGHDVGAYSFPIVESDNFPPTYSSVVTANSAQNEEKNEDETAMPLKMKL